MDWGSLAGSLAQLGLTGLGTAFGGPLGGTIGGALGTAIAGALGVEATPAAVQAAIAADPEAAKARLADLESARQTELAAYQAQLADVQDARRTMVQLVQADTPMAWGAVVVSIVMMGITAAVIVAVGLGKLPDNGIVVGWALAQATTVVGYWIGSSSGSKRNADALRSQSAQLPDAIGQAIGAAVGRAVRAH